MHEKHRNSKHFQASMLYFSNLREVHVSFMNHRNPFHFFKFKEISLCDKTLLRLSTSSIQIITVRDFSFSSPLRNGLNDMTQFLRDGVRGESVDKRIICRSSYVQQIIKLRYKFAYRDLIPLCRTSFVVLLVIQISHASCMFFWLKGFPVESRQKFPHSINSMRLKLFPLGYEFIVITQFIETVISLRFITYALFITYK